MTDEKRIRRGSLFDAFRRALGDDVSGSSVGRTPAPAANVRAPSPDREAARGTGFSLVSFYETRSSSGIDDSYLPHFALRAGLPEVTTVAAYAEPVAPTFGTNPKVKA